MNDNYPPGFHGWELDDVDDIVMDDDGEPLEFDDEELSEDSGDQISKETLESWFTPIVRTNK